MQKNYDMDLEYTKPLDEYVLPHEYTDNHFRRYAEKKKSYSKSIKKMMMFASASVLTVNIALGLSFTPSIVKDIPSDDNVGDVVESPEIANEETIIENTEPATDEKLEFLTSYMADFFPLLQQKDAIGIKTYIDELQNEFNQNNELLKDEYGFIDIYGVYIDSENICVGYKSEITQNQGFAFHISNDSSYIRIDLFLADVKNGVVEGNVYLFIDMDTSMDTFEGVFHGGNSELVTFSNYRCFEPMIYELNFVKTCSFKDGNESGHFTETEVENSQHNTEPYIFEYDLDDNGQLIVHDNETILYESDYATENDWNVAVRTTQSHYSMSKDNVFFIWFWREDGGGSGKSYRITQPPLGLRDNTNTDMFVGYENNFIQSVYTSYD